MLDAQSSRSDPAADVDAETRVLVEQADALEAGGRWDDAIELLTVANRAQPDPVLEMRLGRLRNAAFASLDGREGFSSWPPDAPASSQPADTIPEVPAADLSADTLRANVLTHGCLWVRDLLPAAKVPELVHGIDSAFSVWGALRRPFAKPTGSPWFDPLPLDPVSQANLGRTWVTNGAGILTADSPRVLFMVLDAFESAGLREVVSAYLGERPVLSANKCTLRRVPVDSNSGWHQDGAFLGRGIRALNVWLALSDCGVDAPGLDIVPRRFDHIVETGSHGSYFDWAVGPELVQEIAGDSALTRPVFAPGDVLFFDDLFLHSTAAEPSMTRPRYAIETWFFAPSHYPEGHVPLVW